MFKTRLNQRGEATMMIILIVVVVAVGGLFYWRYQAVNKSAEGVSTNVTKNIQKKVAESATPVDNTKYLTINELGVKVNTTDGLSYVIESHDHSQWALLDTTSTHDIAVKCKGSIEGAGLVAIARYNNKLSDDDIGNLKLIKIIGNDYFYLWVAPDCTTVSSSDFTKVIDTLSPIALSVQSQ